MNLDQWQKKNGVNNTAVAEGIGVHPSYITHIKKKRRIPTPKVALRIEQFTDGAVTKESLLWPDQEAA